MVSTSVSYRTDPAWEAWHSRIVASKATGTAEMLAEYAWTEAGDDRSRFTFTVDDVASWHLTKQATALRAVRFLLAAGLIRGAGNGRYRLVLR